MYQIYMLIGTVQLLTGFLVSVYFIYFLTRHSSTDNNTSTFSISQALSTVLIGVLYVYIAVLLSKSNDKVLPNFNYGEETILNDTNQNTSTEIFYERLAQTKQAETTTAVLEEQYLTGEADIDGGYASNTYLNSSEYITEIDSYLHTFKQMLNKSMMKYNKEEMALQNNSSNRRAKQNGVKDDNQHKLGNECNSEEAFYHHVMFVYSFAHGIVFLINSVVECKRNRTSGADKTDQDKDKSAPDNSKHSHENADEITEETNQVGAHTTGNTETTSSALPKNVSTTKVTFHTYTATIILMSWLIPTVSTSCLFFVTYFKHVQNKSVQNMTKYLLESKLLNEHIFNVIKIPLNKTTITNNTEVSNIISEVYKIMNTTKEETFADDIMDFLLNKYNNTEVCIYDTVALKIYVFLIIAVAYVVMIMYSKVVELRTESLAISCEIKALKLRNLKVNQISFTTTWLPGVLELINRKYITPSPPTLLSDLVLLFGNLNQIIAHVSNVFMSRKIIRRGNFVAPQI